MTKKRKTFGSVVKGKDGKPDYIKITNDVNLKKGQYVNLESAKSQIESLKKALSEGKLSEEVATKMMDNANKTPDWVRFNLVVVEEV